MIIIFSLHHMLYSVLLYVSTCFTVFRWFNSLYCHCRIVIGSFSEYQDSGEIQSCTNGMGMVTQQTLHLDQEISLFSAPHVPNPASISLRVGRRKENST